MDINYIKFLMAFAVVLGLIWLLGVVSRKLNLTQLGIKLASSGQKRLQVVSIQALDTRNRLVLIRRDNVEHLLAVTPERITVIEQNITPPASAASSEDVS
jgi:flagellar biogenesis protein FliO